jgi:hypothetical protein
MKTRVGGQLIDMRVHQYPDTRCEYERPVTNKGIVKLARKIGKHIAEELLRGAWSKQRPPYPGYRAVGGLFRIPKTEHSRPSALLVLTVPMGDADLLALNLRCDAYLNLPHYDPPSNRRGVVLSSVVWSKAALQ